MRKTPKTRSCTILFNDSFENELRQHYNAFTHDIEMTETDRKAIFMALSELALNALEHSKARDNQVALHFQLVGDRVIIRVRDRGCGLENTGSTKKLYRGNGLKIVRALCDRVNVHSSALGLHISITKNLRRPQIGGFSI